MKFYFAPMEGITGYLYRNAFHEYFGKSIDKYFTPFMVTAKEGKVKNRSLADVLPEHNKGIPLVPQLLGNCGEDFLTLCRSLKEMGYREVNLNLGCPSGTVTAKGKGAGFLARKEELDRFLDEIFEKAEVEISIKTRIGMDSEAEWEALLQIYQSYPLSELIVHPRLRQDFYGNKPRLAAFGQALATDAFPVCYNGDLFTKADYIRFKEQFPRADRVMIGRGFLQNPGLLWEIREEGSLDLQTFRAFHDRLYGDYLVLMQGEKNALFKMKELWSYWQVLFAGEQTDRCLKRIRRAQRGSDYEAAVRELLGSVSDFKMTATEEERGRSSGYTPDDCRTDGCTSPGGSKENGI